MKKNFLLTTIVCIILLFSFNDFAQSQVKYGAGLSYGTWLRTPGLNLRADVELFEGFSIVPMVDIYIPRLSSGAFLNSASVHLHYQLEVLNELTVYPLIGAALKSYLDFDRVGYDRVYHRFSGNAVGGGGAQLKLSREFYLFAEARLELGNYWQFVTTGGILIRPGR